MVESKPAADPAAQRTEAPIVTAEEAATPATEIPPEAEAKLTELAALNAFAYDQAREVHNATFDRRPLAIVEASSAADVARTVLFARETGLELAVRGGAHSVAGFGTSEGGIVLDLGRMKGLHIDPVRRLAWAQAGLRAGEAASLRDGGGRHTVVPGRSPDMG